MNPHTLEAYRALRAYLAHLLHNRQDKALEDIPDPLRVNLEAFMQGKTVYHDTDDRPFIYAHDLAAWAYQVIYVSGLEYPVFLATVDINSVRQATTL